MEKTKFGMELGSRKSSPMLEISYNTVKKDGSFGSHENGNEDMEDCWHVNYDGFCCVVDSAARIIQLGAVDIRQADLMGDWFNTGDFGAELQWYPHFLNRLVAFIGEINGLDDENPPDPTIATFGLLWSNGYISEDPITVAKVMEVDPAYLDSFIQWYVELGNMEYTPWIEKYMDSDEIVDYTIGKFLPDWFQHHNSLSKSEYEDMRIFHENNTE